MRWKIRENWEIVSLTILYLFFAWLFISSRWRHLLSFKLVFDARHTEASLLRPHYPLSNHKNNNSWLMTMVPSLFRHARLRIKRMETSQDSNIWSVSIQGRHSILVHFQRTFSFPHQKNKSKSTKNIKRNKKPINQKAAKSQQKKKPAAVRFHLITFSFSFDLQFRLAELFGFIYIIFILTSSIVIPAGSNST